MQQHTQSEQWRAIPGFEGHYEVSNMGRVRGLNRVITRCDGITKTIPARMLKMPADSDGYKRVNLRGAAWAVHRLVLLAFVGSLPKGLATRHLNGNVGDNRLSNLAYGTYSENNYDLVRHGTHYKAKRTHCPRGHVLADPNLNTWMRDRGYRTCKACTRARATLQKRPDLDMDTVADEKYAAIMGQARRLDDAA